MSFKTTAETGFLSCWNCQADVPSTRSITTMYRSPMICSQKCSFGDMVCVGEQGMSHFVIACSEFDNNLLVGVTEDGNIHRSSRVPEVDKS